MLNGFLLPKVLFLKINLKKIMLNLVALSNHTIGFKVTLNKSCFVINLCNLTSGSFPA